MSQSDPLRPHNPGEYVEDPYAGETGARSEFGTAESVPPAVPPTGVPPVPPTGTTESSSSSTTDVAKGQASEVKDTTKQAGQQVVHETKQQVAQVASEAKNQTGNLLRQGVSEINSQAGQQQQRLAQSVHSIAKELGSMASSSDESGPMTGLAQDASRRAGEVAHWLENHEPNDILEGLRSFARRRPGTFLLGAAAAGVLVGRLTRGIAAEAKSDHSGSGNQLTSGNQSLPGDYSTGTGAGGYSTGTEMGGYSTGTGTGGYSNATDPFPTGNQPAPAGPEYSQGPTAPVGETGFDDTLPRGLGEAGPR